MGDVKSERTVAAGTGAATPNLARGDVWVRPHAAIVANYPVS
jgi:hypothetical protein